MATKAAAKKTGTNVVAWQEKMREAAKNQIAHEKVGGNFKSISTRGGTLSIDDSPIKDNELRCVVLLATKENQYYTERFDPDKIAIPTCYAFAGEQEDEEDMVPHKESKEVQAKSCADCEWNVMGSADTGKGKACKNIRRLAVITEGDLESAEAVDNAEVRILKVPVTSVKNWGNYVDRIAKDQERPTWGVITLVKLVDDKKTQFKIQFGFEELIELDQELVDALEKKRTKLATDMMLPYQEPAEEEKPARKGRGITKAGPRSKITTPAKGKNSTRKF